MEKLFVPYDETIQLKEIGFDEPCLSTYHKIYHTLIKIFAIFTNQDVIKAPLYQQAFDWFREKHDWFHMLYPRDGWNYNIQYIDETVSCGGNSFTSREFKTYEEARLACLRELIKITKYKIENE